MNKHRIRLSLCWVCLMISFPYSAYAKKAEDAPGRVMARQAISEKKAWITVDHSKIEKLNAEFKSGKEVTDACISCHNQAHTQVMQTIHWTWIDPNSPKEKLSGKAGYSVNNFCIGSNMMNDKSCMSCHPSWQEKAEVVNCLVCHAQEKIKWDEAFDDYNGFMADGDEESKNMAGDIQKDIQKSVKSVALPTRNNCGGCHFYGGGGDGVKHGDLDSSLIKPNKALDVHMGEDSRNFQCVRCHTTKAHHIAGRVYSTPAATERRSLIEDDMTPKIMCESCHTSSPHKTEDKPNDHTDKVACQTCHIPEFARVNPTKMSWDWSKAGKKKEGKPYKEKDEFGKESYLSIKGQMKWAKNVRPEYFWFNGSIHTLTVKDKIDPSKPVKVSWPRGSRTEVKSRIFPFKIHTGKQPYDKINKTLIDPLVSGENGYWTTLDWQDALKRGSDLMGVPYSGEFDFAETSYVFPTTHMVAPRENAVKCSECHTRNNGRMAKLMGFYMPGRDSFKFLDWSGWLLVLGSLAGVLLHGLGRIFTRGKKEH